ILATSIIQSRRTEIVPDTYVH
ncbi:MAG: hypothetical protein JWO97_4606, partial [Acidobacteria bacterium]|nr:hypothetical protein [Acidobacteriota bacterium]